MRNVGVVSDCLIALLILQSAGALRMNHIRLIENGYDNILIAIQEDVPENRQLLNEIRDAFSRASVFLYKATQNRAYFRSVSILVPISWSDDASYERASIEQFNNADIRVTYDDSNFDFTDPFVKTLRGCGQSGEYMQISNSFVKNDPSRVDTNTVARLLVRGWGQLRWGVFSEHADDVGNEFYYSATTDSYEATRCTKGLKGRLLEFDGNGIRVNCTLDPLTGRYREGCKFYAYSQRDVMSASIMDEGNSEASTFCETSDKPNTGHNAEAQNKHNRLCDSRSTWEVISNTPDFVDNKNTQRDIPQSELKPRFTLLRHKESFIRLVLVLDESSDDLLIMNQIVSHFIRHEIKDGTQLGIVVFNTVARVVVGLQQLRSNRHRESMVSKLPSRRVAGTPSIGSGIMLAVEILSALSSHEGAIILIVADGVQQSAPYIEDVVNLVVKSQIVVHGYQMVKHSISRGMRSISDATGGDFYIGSDIDVPSTKISMDFTAIANNINSAITDDTPTINVFVMSNVLASGEIWRETTILTLSLGANTVFSLRYNGTRPYLTVKSPSGFTYGKDHNGVEQDSRLKVTSLHISGIAESGTWTFTVKNTDHIKQYVGMTFSSQQVYTKDKFVLKYHSPWPPEWSMMADVSFRGRAALGLSVVATIDRPVDEPVDMELLDNGQGADMFKNDGIYTVQFAKFSHFGVYRVSVRAYYNKTGDGVHRQAGQRKKRSVSPLDFQIISSGGAIDYFPNRPKGTNDTFPPGQVTNLRVVGTNTNFSVGEPFATLTWTATGDDDHKGQASQYVIKIVRRQNRKEDLIVYIQQADVLIGNLSNPKLSLEQERFRIKVPYNESASTTSMTFTLYVFDEVFNNRSSISVSAGFGHVPDIHELIVNPALSSTQSAYYNCGRRIPKWCSRITTTTSIPRTNARRQKSSSRVSVSSSTAPSPAAKTSLTTSSQNGSGHSGVSISSSKLPGSCLYPANIENVESRCTLGKMIGDGCKIAYLCSTNRTNENIFRSSTTCKSGQWFPGINCTKSTKPTNKSKDEAGYSWQIPTFSILAVVIVSIAIVGYIWKYQPSVVDKLCRSRPSQNTRDTKTQETV